jgi:hypothetical protein
MVRRRPGETRTKLSRFSLEALAPALKFLDSTTALRNAVRHAPADGYARYSAPGNEARDQKAQVVHGEASAT